MTHDYELLAERVRRACANLADAQRQAIKAGLIVEIEESRIHEVGFPRPVPILKATVMLPIG